MPSVLRQLRPLYLVLGLTSVMLVMLLLACDSRATGTGSSTPVTTALDSPAPGAVQSRVVMPIAVPSGVPVLPTPQPTVPPTFPPTQTPDLRPTQPPPPTPTTFVPKPLTDPLPDPRQQGVQWFSQTGHTLRGTFLDYWNQHGGMQQFGYPLTEEFVDASGPGNMPLTVQYFERNRFELHRENVGTSSEVLISAQNERFSGIYPLYGYAVDFSWVAGLMTRYAPYNCFRPECGCSILRYQGQDNEPRVQLGGQTWLEFQGPGFGVFSLQGSYFIAFGHLAGPGEVGLHCAVDGDAEIYFVQSVTGRPSPPVTPTQPTPIVHNTEHN